MRVVSIAADLTQVDASKADETSGGYPSGVWQVGIIWNQPCRWEDVGGIGVKFWEWWWLCEAVLKLVVLQCLVLRQGGASQVGRDA